MKVKNLLLFTLAVMVFSSCSRMKADKQYEMQIPGKIKTFRSEILGEEREIWIYLPASADTQKIQKCHVVYLLDPEDHYTTVVRMMDLFGGNEGLFPEMIIVGIPTPDRVRDMTPSFDPKASESSALPVKDRDFRHSGGAGNFALFIEKEVMPYIDSNYPTSGFSILFGHSLGGLMTVNTLLNHSGVFNAYIAADPSTWWNHREAFNTAGRVLAEKSFRGKLFFYANSNSTKEYSAKLSDTVERNPYKLQLQFGSRFAVNYTSMPEFGWIQYGCENHASLPAIVIFDGLKVASDFEAGYGITDFNSACGQTMEKISVNEYSAEVKEAVSRIGILAPGYARVSPDCEYLKVIDDSLHTSANLLVVMGDMLIARGDSTDAIDSYKKSLRLKPGNEELKEKINSLEAKMSRRNK